MGGFHDTVVLFTWWEVGSEYHGSRSCFLYLLYFAAQFRYRSKKTLKSMMLLATGGLGVSDFVYRIIALFLSVVSGMSSKHGFCVWSRCTGMAVAGYLQKSVFSLPRATR